MVLNEDNTLGPTDKPGTSSESLAATNKQLSLHPSLKKLIGKTPIDYEELLRFKPTPMRQAARTAKSTITEKLTRKKKDQKPNHIVIKHQEETTITTTATTTVVNPEQTKVPRYIPPIEKPVNIPSLNSSRHRNQTRHLIVVGNTSKYIGNEKSKDGVTHKWLVYIKTKTDIPLEAFVKKVRFFLHPSYKPNDVVEVQSPPFQLSRRGWGEFPIRIQLYFDAKTQQKPLQVYHNLVLDRRMTGLQTMGAETVVELWLSSSNEISASLARELKTKSEFIHNDLLPIEKRKIISTITSNSLMNNIGMNSEVNDDVDAKVENLFDIENIKMEPELHLIDNDFFNDVIQETDSKDKSKGIQRHENIPVNSVFIYLCLLIFCYNILIFFLQNPATQPPALAVESMNTIKKNGQIYLVDPTKKTKPARQKNQVSLLKPNLSLLKSSFNPNLEKSTLHQNIITDHDYAGLNTICPPPAIASLLSVVTNVTTKSIFPVKTKTKKPIINQKSDLDYRKILETVFESTTFENPRAAIVFLLKKLPLTTLLVKKPGYLESFPFTVESNSKFNELTKIKQCNYEWLRAKLINKWLKKKFNAESIESQLWTTKEIMLYAKRYGYTPTILSTSNIQSTNTSTSTDKDNIKNLVEKEIKKEKEEIRKNTLTLNHDIYNWMSDYVTQKISAMGIESETIDVETDDSSNDNMKNLNSKNVIKSKYEMQGNIKNGRTLKLWVPLASSLESDGDVVAEMCDDIGIRLDSEEIVDNVYYPAVKHMVLQVYRSFTEDVVRRAYANRISNSCSSVRYVNFLY